MIHLHHSCRNSHTLHAARRLTAVTSTAAAIALGAGCDDSTPAPPSLATGKLLIEHNATDEDTGFQGFADGDPWNELRFTGPDGQDIVTASAGGGLRDFGLTEFFFETNEPENAEVPISDVIGRLVPGTYTMSADLVDAGPASINTGFSHAIPTGPVLTGPVDGATGLDPNAVVVTWDPVTHDIAGAAVTVVGYQVIVEQDGPPEFPDGFARPVLSAHLLGQATQLTVPASFLASDGCYEYEVLAIEQSGNQTLSSAAFETGGGCEEIQETESDVPGLTAAKFLIEHNATDEDTGFQGFADGDPWNELIVTGPSGEAVVTFTARGGFNDFGLTELFYETNEPENAKVPIPDVLARLAPGTYTFTGNMVGGAPSTVTATFSHAIPRGPVLQAPPDEAEDVDPSDVVVRWAPVTTDLSGEPVDIVGYQVIVEEDVEPEEFPQGFAQPVFSIYLPGTATEIRVPAEFMHGGGEYEYEVLAIERSGNQTLSSAAFETR